MPLEEVLFYGSYKQFYRKDQLDFVSIITLSVSGLGLGLGIICESSSDVAVGRGQGTGVCLGIGSDLFLVVGLHIKDWSKLN